MFSIPEPWRGDRKYTTSWIYIISNHKSFTFRSENHRSFHLRKPSVRFAYSHLPLGRFSRTLNCHLTDNASYRSWRKQKLGNQILVCVYVYKMELTDDKRNDIEEKIGIQFLRQNQVDGIKADCETQTEQVWMAWFDWMPWEVKARYWNSPKSTKGEMRVSKSDTWLPKMGSFGYDLKKRRFL